MLSHWLGEVFSHPDLAGALGIVAKTAVIYLFVLVGLRLLGSRELGETTAHDFVLVVVIAIAVQNALVGGDNTLAGGLVSVTVLLLANRLLALLVRRVPVLRRLLVGTHLLLVRDGQVIPAQLRAGGMTTEELMQGIRRRGYDTLEDVRFAILEADGRIAVIPRESEGGARK